MDKNFMFAKSDLKENSKLSEISIEDNDNNQKDKVFFIIN